MAIDFFAPDLTQHPPRSPRVRLGGYAMLPRSIDKARAKTAGKLGEYLFPNPFDCWLLEFVGIPADDFLACVASGKSDSEILVWVNDHASPKRADWEIVAWSSWLENLAPGNVRRHRMFADQLAASAPQREDIRTLIDRLDFDDYISFGGHP
ncbi:MAG TPA: DUF5069 domain-containing protein [Rariglobus sp.]|jgi:hypothetical protein|nr:DUF5069 domain-containing protein [Rariglobus sp.]